MDRDIPIFNVPIMKMVYQQNRIKHLQRIQNVKSEYDYNKTQRSFSINPAKTYLQQLNKKKQISNQNKLLFIKIRKIQNRQDKNNTGQSPNFKSYQNRRRLLQQQKINQQNKRLFERLKNKKPVISAKELFQQRLRSLNLKSQSKYQNPLLKQSFRRAQSVMKNHQLQTLIQQQVVDQQYSTFKHQSQRSKKIYDIKNIKTQPREQNTFFQKQQRKSKNKHQIILYQTKTMINQKEAQIFIIRHNYDYQFKIVSKLRQHKAQYSLKMNEHQGEKFFEKYDYDYQRIIEMLSIQNETITINPNNERFKVNKVKKNKKKSLDEQFQVIINHIENQE